VLNKLEIEAVKMGLGKGTYKSEYIQKSKSDSEIMIGKTNES
jgi:hypothetical protein